MSDGDERPPEDWTPPAPPPGPAEGWARQVNTSLGELVRALATVTVRLDATDAQIVVLTQLWAEAQGRWAQVADQVDAVAESLVHHQGNEGRHR